MPETIGKNLDFTSKEKRKEFVNDTKTGVYFGRNSDGDALVIKVIQGEKLIVQSNGESKMYDKNGEKVNESSSNWLLR